jgi:serine phosphatase RsbU (regulator of sigma subunit)
MLWLAAGNRAVVFLGVAALVAFLLRRERRLTLRLAEQQDELAEFQALRAALTPTDVPVRPRLQIATAFTPADGLVAGDFFLVVEGPADSTTVVVGDVVGHGLEAARCAAFVRAALATFARFSSDPAQLLQLADAALTEHGLADARFVTAVCLNVAAPPARELVWATAGHDVPWQLDTAVPLPGGRIGPPLGTGAETRPLESGRTALAPGEGVLVFTDGLTEGRPRRDPSRTTSLFGEERARRVVREQRGAPVGRVLEALSAAVEDFSGGRLADDLCLVALRTEAPSPD